MDRCKVQKKIWGKKKTNLFLYYIIFISIFHFLSLNFFKYYLVLVPSFVTNQKFAKINLQILHLNFFFGIFFEISSDTNLEKNICIVIIIFYFLILYRTLLCMHTNKNIFYFISVSTSFLLKVVQTMIEIFSANRDTTGNLVLKEVNWKIIKTERIVL